MKILSFDVGIKNLAYCLINYNNSENKFNIEKWDIINLCGETPYCCFKNNNKICSNKAKYQKNNTFSCKIHAKTYNYIIPESKIFPKGLTIKKITNAKILSLKELALQFNIDIANCSNKNQILEKIQEHIEKHFWEPVNINKADNVDLISLGRTMKKELDTLFELEIPDIILIENQISPIANRMKTLQGMIAQYFIDRNANKIIFVSASNKLKHFNEEVKVKTTYSDRKQKSIEITKKEILNLDNNSNNETKWYEYFNKHKKNDDLADSYLQALWFMNHSYLDIE